MSQTVGTNADKPDGAVDAAAATAPIAAFTVTTEQMNSKLIKNFSRGIIVCGPSQLGIVTWCKAHFKHPFIATKFNDLKQLTLKHDGIIFKDVNWAKISVHDIRSVLDVKSCRSLTAPYKDAIIPAKIPRMVITNDKQMVRRWLLDGGVQWRAAVCWIEQTGRSNIEAELT